MVISSIRRSVASLLLLVFSSTAFADAISIRADEWLPYNGPSTKKPPGYMIELAEKIAVANGHTIAYSTMPWDDAVAAVRRGAHDCVVGALKSDAEDFMFPSESWGESQSAFYALNDSKWRYAGIDSLANQRLAVIESYSYSDEIDAYVEKFKNDPTRVVVVSSAGRAGMNAMSLLIRKKADVFVEDVNVAKQTIAKLNLQDRVVMADIATESDTLYIACTPADPRGRRYAEMFSAGIAKLRKSGELATILAKYHLADWKID
ncbi:MAG: transporter substrate-binding domain-containing protein [Xanthomonadales bacterium]|nr:transporter substrate-binding domain-containing protein [Xanthomonadales bacterium]